MSAEKVIKRFAKNNQMGEERGKLNNKFLKLLLLFVFLNLFSFASFGVRCNFDGATSTLNIYADEGGKNVGYSDMIGIEKEKVLKVKIHEGVEGIAFGEGMFGGAKEISIASTTNCIFGVDTGFGENLECIEVAEGNERYKSMNGGLYEIDKDRKTGEIYYTLLKYPAAGKKDIIIPEKVKYIERFAFKGVTAESLTMFADIEEIYSNTFEGSSIRKVEFKGTMEQLYAIDINECGNKALANINIECTNGNVRNVLDNFDKENGILKINDCLWRSGNSDYLKKEVDNEILDKVSAKRGVKKEEINEIVIPESVKIVSCDFIKYPNLKELYLPASMEYINMGYTSRECFISMYVKGCKNLERIVVAEGNKLYKSMDGGLYEVYRDSKTGEIRYLLIWYPAGKKDDVFKVPNGVMQICSDALKGAKFKKVILAASTHSVNNGGCDEDGNEYYDCCFNQCENLSGIEVEKGNKYYQAVDNVLYEILKERKTGKRYARVIYYPKNKEGEEWNIPEYIEADGEEIEVREIVSFVFRNNEKVKKITMPASITKIGIGAFEGSCLKEVNYLETPEEFAAIEICENNEALEKAKIQYIDKDEEMLDGDIETEVIEMSDSDDDEGLERKEQFFKRCEFTENSFGMGKLYFENIEEVTAADVDNALKVALDQEYARKGINPAEDEDYGSNLVEMYSRIREVHLQNIGKIEPNVFCLCEMPKLEKVFFYGTRAQWNTVEIGAGNEALKRVIVYTY